MEITMHPLETLTIKSTGKYPSNKFIWISEDGMINYSNRPIAKPSAETENLTATHGECPQCKEGVKTFFSKERDEWLCKRCGNWWDCDDFPKPPSLTGSGAKHEN